MGLQLPDAASIARSAGIPLQARGPRLWACCPLHGEKTASLCFYPDGGWYCFGCHAHGDAADLYAALHGVSLGEALRVLRGGSGKPLPKPRGPTAADLHRRLSAWRDGKWRETVKELHTAHALLRELEQRHAPDRLMQMDAFWDAADRRAVANDTLNLLQSATMAQLMNMCTEEECKTMN